MSRPHTSSWRPHHQALLDALGAALLLAPLREALALTGSQLADRALLSAMLEDPALSSPIAALERGETTPLVVAVRALYPRSLTPAVVHHLALIALRSGPRDEQLRGFLGMLWLGDRHPDHLRASAAPAARERDDDGHALLDETLAQLPRWLLAPVLDAARQLGAPGVDGQLAERAWETLSALIDAVAQPDFSDRLRDDLAALRAEVVADAVQHCIARSKGELLGIEAAAAEGRFDAISRPFDAACALRRLIGEDPDLTLWIVQEVTSLAWDIYRAGHMEALSRLLTAVAPFGDDLGDRLEAGALFGHQSTFADFAVLRSEATQVEEDRQALLRRATRVCPEHRNARVCLASSNLRLARQLLRKVNLRWPASVVIKDEASAARVRRVGDLIDEAERLRPEHASLSELRAAFERAHRRHGG